MSDVYESIVAGLQEAIEDAKSKEKKLPRRVVTVVPVKEYNASEVKKIRNETGMSQKTVIIRLPARQKKDYDCNFCIQYGY
jgi:putative transcriptional regulator